MIRPSWSQLNLVLPYICKFQLEMLVPSHITGNTWERRAIILTKSLATQWLLCPWLLPWFYEKPRWMPYSGLLLASGSQDSFQWYRNVFLLTIMYLFFTSIQKKVPNTSKRISWISSPEMKPKQVLFLSICQFQEKHPITVGGQATGAKSGLLGNHAILGRKSGSPPNWEKI